MKVYFRVKCSKYTFLQMNDDIQIHDKYRYFTCLS